MLLASTSCRLQVKTEAKMVLRVIWFSMESGYLMILSSWQWPRDDFGIGSLFLTIAKAN